MFLIFECLKRLPFLDNDSSRLEFTNYNKINKNVFWYTSFIARVENFAKASLPANDVEFLLNYLKENKLTQFTSVTVLGIKDRYGVWDKRFIKTNDTKRQNASCHIIFTLFFFKFSPSARNTDTNQGT